MDNPFDSTNQNIAWCPGCGDFGILNAVKKALHELELDPRKVVVVSGIGQAAKIPQYINAHMFNGLHGRALPPATGIKAVNPGLTVIAESGDGDMYGEGGNHFMHTIRRNPNITNIVHNNMVYGLTKGQASPTSPEHFMTPVQVDGVHAEPFNPLAVAVALNASFVARSCIGNAGLTCDIIKQAITHKGYALVDILQPCVTFNKINTYEWFKDHTYVLPEEYDPTDRNAVFAKVTESGKMALGVLYKHEERSSFEETLPVYEKSDKPLFAREKTMHKLTEIITAKK